uniref:Uncharacterized protein n=1 Tax=Attheya septentrionalis TaxID=420275 RepID=A0A7S2XRK6_9STRA|mmetsp:Transcript_3173/g.5771  ORF Transcript_3173/g.5771 Transcript_3173/m.5771 type:complete len:100 (+) Transcript_3173:433-732(+)
MKEDQGTFLVIGSLPCLRGHHRELLLFVNDEAVAMSKVIEQFRVISHISHNFHEILELKRGDRVSISIFPTERETYDEPRSLEFGPLKDRLTLEIIRDS